MPVLKKAIVYFSDNTTEQNFIFWTEKKSAFQQNYIFLVSQAHYQSGLIRQTKLIFVLFTVSLIFKKSTDSKTLHLKTLYIILQKSVLFCCIFR